MPTGLLLLIPCVIVIAGSLMKKPTIPVMIISSAVAVVIAMAIQGFSFSDCAASMVSGFKMEMLHTSVDLENIVSRYQTFFREVV
ncbi:MAG: Na+/H+ antiporter NhaC family protein [Lachnospiraceae bacterium]